MGEERGNMPGFILAAELACPVGCCSRCVVTDIFPGFYLKMKGHLHE